MHLSLVPRGSTPGTPLGYPGVWSILGKKLCPWGWGIVHLLQGMLKSLGMHPRDYFVVPWSTLYTATCVAMRPGQLFRFKLILHCRLGSCGKSSINFSIILGHQDTFDWLCSGIGVDGIKNLLDLIGDNSCQVRKTAQMSYIELTPVITCTFDTFNLIFNKIFDRSANQERILKLYSYSGIDGIGLIEHTLKLKYSYKIMPFYKA